PAPTTVPRPRAPRAMKTSGSPPEGPATASRSTARGCMPSTWGWRRPGARGECVPPMTGGKTMKHMILASIAGLGLLAMAPEAAAEYKCACYAPAKPGIEGSKDANMTCSETYDKFDNSVSVQESHLKIYVDSKNTVQGDKDMNIRFRPRDGKCLERVADGVRESIIWEGAYCNNSSYK